MERVVLMLCLISTMVHCNDIKSRICSDITKKPMTSISSFFHCTPRYVEWMNSVVCETRTEKSTQYYAVAMTFKVLDQVPTTDNSSDVFTRCVGLDIFFLSTKDYTGSNNTAKGYSLGLDPLFPAGILKADPKSWNSTRSCDIYILDEILEKQIFSFTPPPSLNSFWKFSWPKFQLPLRRFEDHLSTAIKEFSVPILKQDVVNNSIEILLIPVRNVHELWETFETYGIYTNSNMSRFFDENAIGTPGIQYFTLYNRELKKRPENINKSVILGGPFSYNYALPVEEISKLTTLKSLIMQGIPILITSRKLPFLPELKELILRECEISMIQEEDLKNFPALEYLDLSGNSIEDLSENTFIHQHNLQKVDLSRNKLINWPIFYDCTLQVLDMSHNSLDHLENIGIYRTTVESLNISSNSIEMWNDQKIFSLNESEKAWVKNLNLSNNPISILSEVMIESFRGISTVDLLGVQFKCEDCRKRLSSTLINFDTIQASKLSNNVTSSAQVQHFLSVAFILFGMISHIIIKLS